jgi:hypothetical protein
MTNPHVPLTTHAEEYATFEDREAAHKYIDYLWAQPHDRIDNPWPIKIGEVFPYKCKQCAWWHIEREHKSNNYTLLCWGSWRLQDEQ